MKLVLSEDNSIKSEFKPLIYFFYQGFIGAELKQTRNIQEITQNNNKDFIKVFSNSNKWELGSELELSFNDFFSKRNQIESYNFLNIKLKYVDFHLNNNIFSKFSNLFSKNKSILLNLTYIPKKDLNFSLDIRDNSPTAYISMNFIFTLEQVKQLESLLKDFKPIFKILFEEFMLEEKDRKISLNKAFNLDINYNSLNINLTQNL